MKLTEYSEVILSEQDIVNALYSGKITSLDNLNIEDVDVVEQFNQARKKNADPFPELKLFEQAVESLEEWDRANQEKWFMPEDYFPNIVEHLYGLCNTQEEEERVSLELELFIQHDMFELLVYLKYLVDTMRKNNIVWGVGRGSSVASYVLYLLGVHKVNSIKYELDIHEFLK
jgi:DNA polymerase III alpha subunit